LSIAFVFVLFLGTINDPFVTQTDRHGLKRFPKKSETSVSEGSRIFWTGGKTSQDVAAAAAAQFQHLAKR